MNYVVVDLRGNVKEGNAALLRLYEQNPSDFEVSGVFTNPYHIRYTLREVL